MIHIKAFYASLILLIIIIIIIFIINNFINIEYRKENIENNMIISENIEEKEKNNIEIAKTESTEKNENKKQKVEKKAKEEKKDVQQKKKTETKSEAENKDKNTTSTKSTKKTTTQNTKEIFSKSKIPESILNKMIGNSIPKQSKNKVNTNNLSYLKITYWGFDKKTHVGEMIVNKKVAQEVLDIFKEVYKKKYPIEKIRLIDEYGANDEKSMRNNNTSAFCYRVVANTKTLSNHSLGCAIDVNPLYNPYIVGKYISPSTATKYVDRSLNKKGMIKKGDVLYNAFIKRGWTWGGNWKSKKDYQHFEKSIL